VAAAVTGRLAEVVQTAAGPVRALRSADPDVLMVVGLGGKHAAYCLRCTTSEPMPAAPSSRGLDGTPVALVVPGGQDHALFVLTWLNAFTSRHVECRPAPTVSQV
jgi:hypothetical protein